MSALFNGAHPLFAELLGIGAIVAILAVFLYIISHDDDRR